MSDRKESHLMYLEKTKRMLAYLGFQDIHDLSIDIDMLKFNSAKIIVEKNNGVKIFTVEVYCFHNQLTQWYIDIPLMVIDNKKTVKPFGHIENSLLHDYITNQTRYLRLFDNLYKNAIYLDEKIVVNMDIIDTVGEEIPENEFNLVSFTFTSKVKHPKVAIHGIGTIIEHCVTKLSRAYGIALPVMDTNLSEQAFQDVLLLCDMVTI